MEGVDDFWDLFFRNVANIPEVLGSQNYRCESLSQMVFIGSDYCIVLLAHMECYDMSYLHDYPIKCQWNFISGMYWSWRLLICSKHECAAWDERRLSPNFFFCWQSKSKPLLVTSMRNLKIFTDCIIVVFVSRVA